MSQQSRPTIYDTDIKLLILDSCTLRSSFTTDKEIISILVSLELEFLPELDFERAVAMLD